ncbi:MAG: AAA family ATPase [Pseudomonadota bacterium]
MPVLICLAGLPGVGKTTLARRLAQERKAVFLRVDSVEAAMKNSTLRIRRAEDAGYLALVALAKDNLGLGLDVVADTVNPAEFTRQIWAEAAEAVGAQRIDIEVICSDKAQHRQRVEARKSDLKGGIVPDWQAVLDRAYAPWQSDRIIVDTSTQSPSECAALALREIAEQERRG